MDNGKLAVDPSTVGDEPKLLDLVHEILERGFYSIIQLGLNQPFDDPETVPVI